VTGCGNTLYLDIPFRRDLRISSNKQTIIAMRETFKSHNQTTGADIKTVGVTCVFLYVEILYCRVMVFVFTSCTTLRFM